MDRGLSQGEVARKSGIWQPVISTWELDKVNPTLPMAIILADTLGISLDELVGRTIK